MALWNPASSAFVHAPSRLEAPHHEQCTRQTAHGNFFYILPRAPDPNQSGMFPPTPVRGSLLLQSLKVFKLVISVKNGTFDTKPQSVWVVAAAVMDQSHVALN